MHRPLLAALLALLLTLGGCSAVLPADGPEEGTTPTSTAAPVPVGDGAPLPPGVTPSSVNASRLVAATTDGITGENVGFQFDEREARPEFSLGTVYVGPRVTVESVAVDRYTVRIERVSERGGGLSVETFENATYATPDQVYRYDGENLTVRPLEPEAVGRPSALVAGCVRTYLDVEEVRVTRVGEGAVRIEGEGTRAVNGTDYSVSAVVGENGVVRSFEAIYTHDGRVQFATFTLERGGAFSPPEWYDPAAVTATPTDRAESATPDSTNTTATPA
jgi:hypothetical protein